jgi:hypothetical protein
MWLQLAREHLKLPEYAFLQKESFWVCYDDNTLFDKAKTCDLDEWTALVRGHLCFVHNVSSDRWTIFRDEYIVADNVDLRKALEKGGTEAFKASLNSLRRAPSRGTATTLR